MDLKPYRTPSGLEMPLKCLYSRKINGFYVPCGKCEFCRQRLAEEWSIRLEEQAFDSFVYSTLLTYNDEELPYYKGEPCVSKIHCQEFLKRFRHHITKHFGAKLKYFLVAEYGAKKGRPHYHLILMSDKPLLKKSANPYEFVNNLLEDSWRHGYASFDKLDNVGSTVFYTTAYMINYDDGKEYDKFNKPFRLMSQGLGKNWLDRYPQQIKKMINEMDYTTFHNGYNKPLPRYLKRKIMPEEQQIAFADNFYEFSYDFENNLNKMNYEERNKFFRKLKTERDEQKCREQRAYRKAKVHEYHTAPSQLSSRASRSKIK